MKCRWMRGLRSVLPPSHVVLGREELLPEVSHVSLTHRVEAAVEYDLHCKDVD